MTLICLTIKILLVKFTIKKGRQYIPMIKMMSVQSQTNSAILNFMSRIVAGDEILEGIISLNFKQHDIFNIVHS